MIWDLRPSDLTTLHFGVVSLFGGAYRMVSYLNNPASAFRGGNVLLAVLTGMLIALATFIGLMAFAQMKPVSAAAGSWFVAWVGAQLFEKFWNKFFPQETEK